MLARVLHSVCIVLMNAGYVFVTGSLGGYFSSFRAGL